MKMNMKVTKEEPERHETRERESMKEHENG